VAEQRPPVDRAVEALVYAPLGLVLYARDALPGLVTVFAARGKREAGGNPVERTLQEARGLAASIVPGAPTDVIRRVEQGLDLACSAAADVLDAVRSWRRTDEDPGDPMARPTTAPAPTTPPAGPPPTSWSAPAEEPTGAAPAGGATIGDAPLAPPTAAAQDPWRSGLAIPGYDELSASQVVDRLEGLSRDELEAIRRHELANRGRTTILGKVAQLTR
jgi:hypothetical protein